MNQNSISDMSSFDWPKIDTAMIDRIVLHSKITSRECLLKYHECNLKEFNTMPNNLFRKNSMLFYQSRSGMYDACSDDEFWSADWNYYHGVIPNPIDSSLINEKHLQSGQIGEYCVKERCYIVLKLSLEVEKKCYAIVDYLAYIAPLILLKQVTQKSVEAWFYCENQSEANLVKFLRLAAKLGADPETFSPASYVTAPQDECGSIGNYPLYYRHPLSTRNVWKFDRIPKCCESSELNFEFKHFSELTVLDEAEELVEGLLTAGQASTFYGASNVGKSFLLLDIGAHIAMGRMWHSRKVTQGGVLYLSLEGKTGLQKRLKALHQNGVLAIDAPLYVHTMQMDFLASSCSDKIIKVIKEYNRSNQSNIVFVVVDTLSRAISGGDENNSSTMSKYIATIDAITNSTGAHVASIHHTGKDPSRGARGHNSTQGAVDTEVVVFKKKDGATITARVEKQRDGTKGDEFDYRLRQVNLDNGSSGESKTSCVVQHIRKSQLLEDEIVKKVRSLCLLHFLPKKADKEWCNAAMEYYRISRSTFYEWKKLLKEGEHYQKTGEGIEQCP